jgi:alkylhydroperoxidase/carboxymuconolactone decarboxylase family protein YurZ
VLATVLTLVTEMELARGDEGDLVIDVGLDVTETVSLRTRELVTLSALSLLRSVDQLVVRFNSELEDFLRGTERTVL